MIITIVSIIIIPFLQIFMAFNSTRTVFRVFTYLLLIETYWLDGNPVPVGRYGVRSQSAGRTSNRKPKFPDKRSCLVAIETDCGLEMGIYQEMPLRRKDGGVGDIVRRRVICLWSMRLRCGSNSSAGTDLVCEIYELRRMGSCGEGSTG